jgi:hypothetical protein
VKWLQLKVETESVVGLLSKKQKVKNFSAKENSDFNEQRISFDVNFQHNSTYT